jgi:hypothetical protein
VKAFASPVLVCELLVSSGITDNKRANMETETLVGEKVVTVGPDRVRITAAEVVIDAKRPLHDWDIREINQVPIYFQDEKFYLVEKRKAEAPFAERYVLVPWPPDLTTCAKGFHSYDAETVAERDCQHRGDQRDELIHALLLPFYPVLGFLWSGTQKRLARFGFAPHLLSGASIFAGFCLLFAQGVFAIVLINTSLRSGKVVIGGFIRALAPGDSFHIGPVSIPVTLIDCLLIVALLADVLMRYTEYLREEEWAGGFLEWLKPRKRS